MKKYLILLLIISFCVFSAQAEPTKQVKAEAQSIYQEFLSPFCPGRSLEDCPSVKATELKTEILQDLEQGQSKEDVLRNLENEFGAELNAKPKLQGFSALAWLAPITFALVLALIGVHWIRGNFHS